MPTDLKESMPQSLTESLRDPLGAQAVVFALLLDPGEAVRQIQLAWLDALRPSRRDARDPEATGGCPATGSRGSASLGGDGRPCPVPDDARPSFTTSSAASKPWCRADHKMTPFEYALQRLLIRHVVAHFVRAKPPVVKYTTIAPFGHADLRGPLGTGVRRPSTRPKGPSARSRRA